MFIEILDPLNLDQRIIEAAWRTGGYAPFMSPVYWRLDPLGRYIFFWDHGKATDHSWRIIATIRPDLHATGPTVRYRTYHTDTCRLLFGSDEQRISGIAETLRGNHSC